MNEENYKLVIDKKTGKNNTGYEFGTWKRGTWEIRPSGRRIKSFSKL